MMGWQSTDDAGGELKRDQEMSEVDVFQPDSDQEHLRDCIRSTKGTSMRYFTRALIT